MNRARSNRGLKLARIIAISAAKRACAVGDLKSSVAARITSAIAEKCILLILTWVPLSVRSHRTGLASHYTHTTPRVRCSATVGHTAGNGRSLGSRPLVVDPPAHGAR